MGLGISMSACLGSGGADSETGSTTGATESTAGSADATMTTSSADETGTVDCEDPEAAVEAIFAASCLGSGCHGDDAAGGLDLTAPGWPERVIGQPAATCDGWTRVVPEFPAVSFLVDKLGGSPSCGTPMPLGASLSADEIACVEAWVSQIGAVDCEMCGGDLCVDLMSDPLHCGACDSPCPAGVACFDGSCACPEGTMPCGGECVDTEANGQHCGACDSPCDPGLLCNAGECAAGCGMLTECDGGCVDTSTDALHCGGCDEPCPTGGECMAGMCECPGPDVTYTRDIEPLFVAGCTSMGCHGFPMPQEDLDLREGMGHGELVGVPSTQCGDRTLVVPGQPDDSYLMNKLLGVDMCMGTRMPKGAQPFSVAELDLVASWICKGAPQ